MKYRIISKYLALLCCIAIFLGSINSINADAVNEEVVNGSSVISEEISQTSQEYDDTKVEGDINFSGDFDEDDIFVLKQYLSDNATLNDEQKEIADINEDGKVNNDDLLMLQELLSEKNSVEQTTETISPFIDMKGDINFDTEVTDEDYQLLQEYLAANIEFNEQQIKNADFDGDGKLTIDDVTYMQKRIAYGHVEIKVDPIDQQPGTMPATVPEGAETTEPTTSDILSTMPTDDGDEGIEGDDSDEEGDAKSDLEGVNSIENNKTDDELNSAVDFGELDNYGELNSDTEPDVDVAAVVPDDSEVGANIDDISNLTMGLGETYPGTGGLFSLPSNLTSLNGYHLNTKADGTYTVNSTFYTEVVVRKYTANKTSYYQAKITAKKIGTETLTIYTTSGYKNCLITIKNAPSSVTLNKSSITLGVDEHYDLYESTNSGSYANSTGLKWSSSNSNVVKVEKIGSKNRAKITAEGVGTANVYITTYNGKTAACKVTVKKAPSGSSAIKLNKTSLTLGIGETFDFNSTVQSGSASYHIKYTQSNPFVGSITESGGVFKAHCMGITKIRATTYNDWYIECTVTVKATPAYVTLNKHQITLGVGETFDLNSTPLDGYKNSGGVASYYSYYSTNNSSVATVQKAGGLVKAVRPGTAYVRVTTYNGAYDTCKVIVKNAPTSINLNKTSLTLGVGEKYDLNSSLPSGQGAYDITYSSSNSSIAPVKSAGGIVTANAVGTAYITVKTYNGKTKVCKVTVKSAPTSVSLNKTSVTLGVGQQYDLNSSVPSGQAAYHIAYSSNNKNIASVKAAGGIVTAQSPGTATITAKTYNGKTVTCTVTVKKKPNYVNLSEYSLDIDHTAKSQSIYAYTASDAYCNNDCYSLGYKWYTTNSRVITVKARKTNYADIQVVGVGSAAIYVQTYNGFTARCEITVKSSYRTKMVEKARDQLKKGGKTFCDDMNTAFADWCAIFCGWCIENIGYDRDDFGYNAGVGDPGWYGNVKNNKAKYMYVSKNEEPQPGDLILYSNPQNTEYREHIGIVETVSSNGVITTIEGNVGTSDFNTSTVQEYTIRTDNKSYYGLCTKNSLPQKYNVYCYLKYVYFD